MPVDRRDYPFIEAQLRKQTFGVLTTVSPAGHPQTTGILYGISLPGAPLRLYMLTERSFLKVRNIEKSPKVSFLVPYPHHFLRFVPASCISFQGAAEILPADDPAARASFEGSRILRMNLEEGAKTESVVFISIRPTRSMHCYGVGFGLMEKARNPHALGYSVEIPADRT